jgi:hypothetical protein
MEDFRHWGITEVVCGCARGADQLGAWWAKINRIPVKQYPADWEEYGRYAGVRRNHQMADNADALIAFWDGKSRGTEHMIDTARKHNLKIAVVIV